MTPAARYEARLVPWIVALVLVTAVAGVYWVAGDYPFILFDDPVYVTANPRVLAGLTWDGARWAFAEIGRAGNWHPVTWLSHMVDVEFFGVDAGAHRRVSVGLHAVACVLLFFALRSMLARAPEVGARRATWLAAFAAAVFGLHPLRVESVVWVSERKDVLGAVFWTLAMGAYALYTKNRRAAWYVVVLAAMALGVLSKPTLVTLPVALLLLDLWPLRRLDLEGALADWTPRARSLLLEKVPLAAMAAVSAALTLIAQGSGGSLSAVGAYPLSARFANALISYAEGVLAFVWPLNLAVFYPFPADGVSPLGAALSGAALGLAAAAALGAASRRPWITVGWLWYTITMLPMVGLVQVGLQARADRYTYLPHIGLLLLVVGVANELMNRRRALGIAAALAGVAAIVGCAAVTVHQNGYWRDHVTLFTRAVAVTENNFVAHHALGVGLEVAGDRRAAIAHYRAATAIYPEYASAHRDLGRALTQEGELQAAAQRLWTALDMRPEDARAHMYLGFLHLEAARPTEALESLERALLIDPLSYDAHRGRGRALQLLGRTEEARGAYARAGELRPDLTPPGVDPLR